MLYASYRIPSDNAIFNEFSLKTICSSRQLLSFSGWICPQSNGTQNKPCSFGERQLGEGTRCLPCGNEPCPSPFAKIEDFKTTRGVTLDQKLRTLVPCELGYKCSSMTNKVKCKPGTFTSPKRDTCTECPAGSKCPSTKLPIVILCPPGTFSKKGSTKVSVILV